MQCLMLAAQYYDDEYILKKLLTLNGDADQLEEILDRKADVTMSRFETVTDEPIDEPAGDDE